MQRFGLGLALGHRTAADGKRHALRPFGQYGILRLLAVDAAPARLTDDRSFGDILHTVAHDRYGRYILYAAFGEGFEHTPDDHVVHGLLVGGEHLGANIRRQQRVVVGNFAVVHASERKRIAYQCEPFRPHGVILLCTQQGGYLPEDIFGNIAAARAGIGDRFGLVELLGDRERLLRRKPVLGVGLLLERSQVVEQGRFLHGLLALDFRNADRSLRIEGLVSRFGRGFLFPFLDGGELDDRIGFGAGRG